MRATFGRLIVGAAAVALTAGIGPAAGAAVAEVGPTVVTPCYHGIVTSGQYAWARCNGNSGEFRAVAYCRNVVNGQRVVRYGPFRYAPTALESIALCSSQEVVYDSAVQSSG